MKSLDVLLEPEKFTESPLFLALLLVIVLVVLAVVTVKFLWQRATISVITESELKTASDFSDYGQYLEYFESLPEYFQNKIIAEDMKENEIMMILQIVDFSFTENEATVIYDILHKLVRDGKDQESKEFAAEERRALMKQAYKKFRAYEAQNQDKGTPIKNRFSYFLSILDNWDDAE